jgi:predicted enzyme related to lactoylglutathione lyase
MPERDGYIPGVPCWVDTYQADPEAAVSFYGALFGWEFDPIHEPASAGSYFIARIRGGDVAGIGSATDSGEPTATWNTYVRVDSADEAAAGVRDAGGRVVVEPSDVMDAGRVGYFIDPEGAGFYVWQPNKHPGSRIVNEAGAVNFNSLHTRDVAAATSFYGAVFEWERLSMPGSAEMWALSAYGDELERLNPGNRERVAGFGVTPRFVDVVASISPIPPDRPDVAAHWSVTFGTDDADALAAKAEELGGKVIVPPFDGPWARMTLIADPQGASFIASKFVPENRDIDPSSSPVLVAA